MNKISMQTLRARSARVIKAVVVAAVVSIAAPTAYGTVTAQQPEPVVSDVRWALIIKGVTVCAFKCWRIVPICCEVFTNPR